MNRRDYDVVAAEIHRKALENVTNEMAISLVRTSGSPVVVDAKDFSTCVLDLVPEHLGFAAYVLLHFGTSLLGTRFIRDLTRTAADVRPGDGWIVNDPYEGGAAHQGDVAVVMPMFHENEHVAWGFANMHMLDVGGSGLGGIAPGAADVYAEGIRFPAIRAIRNGHLEPEWQRFISGNVRAPGPVVNDIRSMIAANVVGSQKLSAVISKFGRPKYEELCRINKDVTEAVLRKRIGGIPPGVYEAHEWCEFDGHDGPARLLPISVRLEVVGSDLKFTFSGAPQIDGFINAGRGAMWGQVATALLTTLAYGDLRVNGGFWRPIHIDLGPPGTIVNAAAPAPVSNGHVAVGMRAAKLVFDVLGQALALSDDPLLRARVGAKPHDGPPVAGLIGKNQKGSLAVVFYLDHASGIGGGAQAVGDGQDAYGCACMTGCGLTDLEVHESTDPLLFLARRTVPNSGGPGYHRGGQGIEQAFALQYGDHLAGQLSNPCAEFPASGVGGGLPGSCSAVEALRSTNVDSLLKSGRTPRLDDVHGDVQVLPNNTTRLSLRRGDVLKISGGGGGGLGDPLLREPERVAADVEQGYITPDHAVAAYGVVCEREVVDVKATQELRRRLRRERIGREPAREMKVPASPGVAVTRDPRSGRWLCGSCSSELSTGGSWRDNAVVVTSDLATRFDQLRMQVRKRTEGPAVVLQERFCPQCAMALEAQVVPEQAIGADAVAAYASA